MLLIASETFRTQGVLATKMCTIKYTVGGMWSLNNSTKDLNVALSTL